LDSELDSALGRHSASRDLTTYVINAMIKATTLDSKMRPQRIPSQREGPAVVSSVQTNLRAPALANIEKKKAKHYQLHLPVVVGQMKSFFDAWGVSAAGINSTIKRSVKNDPIGGFNDGGDDDAIEFSFDFCVGETVSVYIARDIVLCVLVYPFNTVMAWSVYGGTIVGNHRNAGIVSMTFIRASFLSIFEFFKLDLNGILPHRESDPDDEKAK